MDMTDESPANAELQTVLETLADCECREILSELESPLSAQEMAERCELSQTSAYRKLKALSKSGLVREGTEYPVDGHHTKTYERSVTSAMVELKGDDGVELKRSSKLPRHEGRGIQRGLPF